MESWNVYSQNTPSTPSSAWLCPNNAPGSDWLHPQSNSNTERERNENNAALATPTRFIMEYNDVNQNSSGSYYNPYAQEMERLFENSFLKIGNPEDLLNNNLSSWLNTNETVVAVTTAASNIIADPVSATTCSNSPTPSLVTDDDQEQLYNKLQERRVSTFIDDDQFPMTINTMPLSTDAIVAENQKNRQIVATSSSSGSTSSSPISPKKSHDRIQREQQQKVHYPMTTSSSFYQTVLTTSDKQDLFTRQRLLTDGKDQYLLAKKHDPKQLLLPLTTTKESMDGTMTVTITSPSPSLTTDDEVDQLGQFQKERHQDFQLSISTNDLPMQQPSPASSEYFSSNSKSPSSSENTPKQKKRRFSQRKTKRPTKANEEELMSLTDEPFSEQEEEEELTNSATITGRTSTVTSAISKDSNESSSIASTSGMSTSIDFSESSTKRSVPDDGHDETPEEKRSRLLERNRIAAAKCRQKKKQAQECLQQQASDLTQKNTTMHSLVNDLREEALKLKNQLLAHSTCNCNVIQEYVRTSGQFAFARAPYSK